MSSSQLQNELPAHAATATYAAIWPKVGNRDACDEDDVDRLPVKQLRTSTKEIPMTKPLGSASSVFEAGMQAKRRRAAPAPPPTDVQIMSGIPIPPAVRPRGERDVYGALLKKMKDGDMVLLDPLQSRTMRSRAKKMGIEVTLRVAENNKVGVWRVGLLASSSNS